jgi:hypothetical protein
MHLQRNRFVSQDGLNKNTKGNTMNKIHKRQKYEKQNAINMISLSEVEINRYSNMTSLKRFEWKPVVKIIFIYEL